MAIAGSSNFVIRDFPGVDLTANARVHNPQAWRQLENLYSPDRGRVFQRPGSILFASKYVLDPGGPCDPNDPTQWPDAPDDYLNPDKPSLLDPSTSGPGTLDNGELGLTAGDILSFHQILQAAGFTRTGVPTVKTTIYESTYT